MASCRSCSSRAFRLIVGANKGRTTIQAAISARRRLSGMGSIAHYRIFESGGSVAILLTSPVEIRPWPLSPSSDFLDEFSKRQLTKYGGQSTRKLRQAGVGVGNGLSPVPKADARFEVPTRSYSS